MKKILFILVILISTLSYGQEKKEGFLKSLYKDFIQYGTIYAAGDISNSIEAAEPTYFVRTGEGGTLYDIPRVEDNTPDHPSFFFPMKLIF